MEYINKYIDLEKFWIRMNEMDFEGQVLAERLYRIILVLFTIIAILSYQSSNTVDLEATEAVKNQPTARSEG